MYFEQFYLGCLAHASYMLGSEGEAAVVDPQRDVEIYLKAADQQGLKIRHIFETHLHADFVSGHVELARRTGAKIYIGAQAGATFRRSVLPPSERKGLLITRFRSKRAKNSFANSQRTCLHVLNTFCRTRKSIASALQRFRNCAIFRRFPLRSLTSFYSKAPLCS